MKTFIINLDEFCEMLFYKMEELSRGSTGHEFRVASENIDDAASKTAELLTPFIKEHLKEI